MSAVIEVKDRDPSGGLAVGLGHILTVVKKEGAHLFWSLLNLHTMGYKEERPEYVEIEQAFELSAENEGVPVTWRTLQDLANASEQIIEIVIAGYTDPNYKPKLSPENPIEEVYRACEIVIELIDGDVWAIYSRSDDLIDTLKQSFQRTEIL